MFSSLLLAVCLASAVPAAEDAAPSLATAPRSFLSDAQLRGVFFLDARRGWAVGDRGAVWHTDDGGGHWTLQSSGADAALYSISMVDEKTGFIAGGDARSFTHDGVGVFLSTRDGGKTWRSPTRQTLPPLRKIRFLDAEAGWAVATPSDLYPSGILLTQDGGRTWKPVSGEAPTPWLTGEMVDPLSGAVAGRNGMAARVLRGGVEPTRGEKYGLRNLRAMQLVPPAGGWLVGDGGLVLTTGDLGGAWRLPPQGLPPQTAAEFDFSALAVRGENVWIAGSPGTRVFHTPDAGRTWDAFPTGNNLPIEALVFADERHGWAVGALGTILATEDGGRTWRRQRCGGTRAALLTLVADAEAVPLELLARLAGQEGYLSAVEVLNRRDLEISEQTAIPLPDRLQQAVVAVGGSRADLAWQFPVRQPGVQQTPQHFIDGWDRTHDGRGLQMLEAHLVRQIRLWRPEIIVTGGAPRTTSAPGESPGTNGALGDLIAQLVVAAAEKAGDATSYPRQITEEGLEPWQAKRVFTSSGSGGPESIELSTAEVLSRLGGAAADAAAEPRGLLHDSVSPLPSTLAFRSVYNRLGDAKGRDDFFAGIVLPPGGEARRELTDPPPVDLAALSRIAQKRRNTLAIVQQAEGDRLKSEQLLAQTGDLLGGLDEVPAAQLLSDLAGRYARQGREAMAAGLYAQLAQNYPRRPLARSALLWLVQYYSSGEAAWREQSRQHFAVRQTSTGPASLGINQPPSDERALRAAEFGRQIEQSWPDLFAEPALRFALAAAHRQQGYPRQAERFYLAQSHGSRGEAWRLCARGEQWLTAPKGEPPKPTMPCFAAAVKPRLDGRLDDEMWKKVKTVPLTSASDDDAEWPARAALAYDREFLYIAIHCRKAAGADYPKAAGPRPRDADLGGTDRVEILIDVNRDYATYYALTIDCRGWTAERCWGDPSWNPTWFVAATSDGETWTVEAAVPWKELVGQPPRANDAWCVGVQRTVPGAGFQSWSTPASTKIAPEGFGYLLFE